MRLVLYTEAAGKVSASFPVAVKENSHTVYLPKLENDILRFHYYLTRR